MNQCTIRDGLGVALDCNQKHPMVVNCAFNDCTRPVLNVPINGVTGFTNNWATGNTLTDEIEVTFDGGSTSVAGNPTWSPANTMNGNRVLIMAVSLVIPGGESLTLSPGMILKWRFAGQQLLVNGPLLSGAAGQSVVLTVIDDDLYGGDTMKDGQGPLTPGIWK